jgi:hypothetical protein
MGQAANDKNAVQRVWRRLHQPDKTTLHHLWLLAVNFTSKVERTMRVAEPPVASCKTCKRSNR